MQPQKKQRTNAQAPVPMAALVAQVVTAPKEAKAAPTPRKPRAPATNVVALTETGKKYSPKDTHKNGISWALIAAHLDKHGSATLGDLVALVPTHKDFVAYAQRRGWLVANTPAIS
jgi:hypothetical protein